MIIHFPHLLSYIAIWRIVDINALFRYTILIHCKLIIYLTVNFEFIIFSNYNDINVQLAEFVSITALYFPKSQTQEIYLFSSLTSLENWIHPFSSSSPSPRTLVPVITKMPRKCLCAINLKQTITVTWLYIYIVHSLQSTFSSIISF